MADTLTAEMAKELMAHHIDFSFASGLYFAGCMQSIADGAHVVIPAEELAKLRADASKLSLYDAAMDAIRDACDKIMGGNLDFIDDDFARCLYSMKAERDRLAGINRQLLEAAQALARIYSPLSCSMKIGSERRTLWHALFDAIAAATQLGRRERESDLLAAELDRVAEINRQLLDALEYALPYLRACVPHPRNGINADNTVDVNCVDRAIAAIAAATK